MIIPALQRIISNENSGEIFIGNFFFNKMHFYFKLVPRLSH